MSQIHLPTTLWRTSTYSSNSGGQCVEVAALSERIGVRDSKNPGAAHLSLTRSTFHTFTKKLRSELQEQQ